MEKTYLNQENIIKKSKCTKEFDPKTELFVDDFVITVSENDIAPKLSKVYLVTADENNFYLFDQSFKAHVYPFDSKEMQKLSMLLHGEEFEDVLIYNLAKDLHGTKGFDVTVESIINFLATKKAQKTVQKPMVAKDCAMGFYNKLLKDTTAEYVQLKRDDFMKNVFESAQFELQHQKILTHVAPTYTLEQLVNTCAILNQEYAKQAILLAEEVQRTQNSAKDQEKGR